MVGAVDRDCVITSVKAGVEDALACPSSLNLNFYDTEKHSIAVGQAGDVLREIEKKIVCLANNGAIAAFHKLCLPLLGNPVRCRW
jgi:hypothetical protein